jgi:methanol--5-hydroxybenzimidazolylcobamide Co-methyltransferase
MTTTLESPRHWNSLTVQTSDQLIFGTAPHPLPCGFGLTIGGGQVFPEVNFTLPAIEINAENWSKVRAHYVEMADQVIRRAVAMQVPGVVLEFELLPAMTEVPEWGAEVTAILHNRLKQAHEKSGLRSALRVTPTDIRDQQKPPLLRTGQPWERLRRSFELCIQAGADIISTESIGGKEVHDPALMYGDIRGILFALGVLAPRDVAWLWSEIASLCRGTRAVPGGDSACGFANTAMQLAHQKMLPEVLAAIVRAASAVRSLAAFEQGAVGPSKDCAYEGPVLKAITGYPIAMEGKSATCAHFSPVGNIASAACDLWSNESVQNIRLLSGNAPEAYTELLAYDCRLMNTATSQGGALQLRKWLTDSDEWRSPQAAVLSPDATIAIAGAIVSADTTYHRTLAAARQALAILQTGAAEGRWQPAKKEGQWLTRIVAALAEMPESEEEILAEMRTTYQGVFAEASYGL